MSIYYKTQIRVAQELFKDTTANDEYVYRQMAINLIKDMPIEALSKIFKFEKVDPFSDESQKVLEDIFSPEWHIERIMSLIEMRQIEFEASIEVS